MNLAIDGIRYHVEMCGNGYPLVLLHGFTGDHTTWTPFCKQWGEHSNIIAIDIIGHGKSDSPPEVERYNILSAADDLNSILEELGITKIDLLGYSMGGRLALTFAVKYPQKVRNLILESASPGLESESERNLRIVQDKKLATLISEKGLDKFIDYWEEIPLFESQKSLSTDIKREIREQRMKNSTVGLKNSLAGMGTGSQPSWWNNLESLEMRVLLVTGSKDQKFCLIAEKMMESLKNAKWDVIDHCGHAIHVEEPEKFGTIVSEFLIES